MSEKREEKKDRDVFGAVPNGGGKGGERGGEGRTRHIIGRSREGGSERGMVGKGEKEKSEWGKKGVVYVPKAGRALISNKCFSFFFFLVRLLPDLPSDDEASPLRSRSLLLRGTLCSRCSVLRHVYFIPLPCGLL